MFRSHHAPKIFSSCLFPILLLALSTSTNAQNRFAVRVTSFPNTVMIGDLRIITGKPEASFLQRNSCLGSTCSSKYNLAGDLATVNGQIKDIAINNVIQSSTPKISGVCSNLIDQNGVITIQSQRSFNFPSSARHTGIASVIAYQGLNNKPQIAFFKHTENPEQIAHCVANLNSTNCNVSGPFVELYRILDSEFQTAWKSNSEYVGAVHSVALGPNGDFAIFSAFSTACQKEILRFQRLNANTGAKIGAPVTLIDCAAFSGSIFGAYAVDLLPLAN
jgi:hypothetical protein